LCGVLVTLELLRSGRRRAATGDGTDELQFTAAADALLSVIAVLRALAEGNVKFGLDAALSSD
jgi:hypothetical protein